MGITARVEINKRLVVLNSAAGIGLSLIDLTVLVWLFRYLLQRISPEEYALYPPVAALMMVLPLLTVVLSSGLERYMVAAYAQGNERLVTQIVSTMFPLHLAIGLLVLAVGGLLSWQIEHLLRLEAAQVTDARIMVLLMNASFVVPFLLAPFNTGFQIRQKLALQNLIGLGTQLTRILILFALIFGVSARVLWVVVASATATIAGRIVMVTISRKLVPALRFRPREIRWPLAKELTSFGGWMLLSEIGTMIRMSASPIILNRLATPLDVTCFSLGSMPYRRSQGLILTLWCALLPQTTAMYATDDRQRLRNTYLRVNRYSLWAGLSVAVPLLLFSPELVRLWVGNKFLPAAAVMTLLLATLPIDYAHATISMVAVAKGQVSRLNGLGLALEFVNLGLTLCFVGPLGLGAAGAAWGTFLTVALGYPLIYWPLGLHLGGVTFREWLRETFLPGLAPGLAGAVVWLALKFHERPATLWPLGACVAVGMVVYALVLFSLCLRPADRADLGRLLRRAPWRRHVTPEVCEGLHGNGR